MSMKKIGGIRFVRIWRLQLSFCVCRSTKSDVEPKRKRATS